MISPMGDVQLGHLPTPGSLDTFFCWTILWNVETCWRYFGTGSGGMNRTYTGWWFGTFFSIYWE